MGIREESQAEKKHKERKTCYTCDPKRKAAYSYHTCIKLVHLECTVKVWYVMPTAHKHQVHGAETEWNSDS
jgi:hypothetical protein